MVTANDSRRCTVARHTPNKRSLRSSFLCRLYRQHFDGPTGSSGSGVDGRFTELDACLPSFELMTPVCRRSPPTVQARSAGGDRQLGGRSVKATEIDWRSEPQPAVGQLKTDQSHSRCPAECRRHLGPVLREG